jgi:hypothetical protein
VKLDYKAEKLAELADAMERLDYTANIHEEKKSEAKDAKENWEACREAVISVANDLREIERGTYQPPSPPAPKLPFPEK